MKLTFVYLMACLAVITFLCWGMFGTATDPTYQQGLTARKQAVEQTKRVQAQEWGNTMRVWGMWGLPAAAFVGGIGLASWMVVEWQRNRTARATVFEEQTTQRHLISAKKDIALAYIAQCGDPGARRLSVNGVEGVYLPSSNELVPIDVCRAELAAAQGTALARRTPQPINVPPVQLDRRLLMSGETEQEDW